MSVYRNKGTTTANVIVTSGNPDNSGNFIVGAADPAVMIEAAWTYLTVFGGGTLVTKGAGETWTTQSVIDSQGDNVTWISDPSLMIQAQAALDANVVSLTHDQLTLHRVYLDGNKANQTDDAGEYNVIYATGVNYLSILECRIDNGYRRSIHVGGASDSNHIKIHQCRMNANGQNNVAGYYNIHIDATGVASISDVTTSENVCTNNTRNGIIYQAVTDGLLLGNWVETCTWVGIGVGEGSQDVRIIGNFVKDTVSNGIDCNTVTGYRMIVAHNTIVDAADDGIAFDLVVGGSIIGNTIYDTTGSAVDSGILAFNSEYTEIADNMIWNVGGQGIIFSDSSNPAHWGNCVGNFIYSPGANGIYVFASDRVNVSSNYIYDATVSTMAAIRVFQAEQTNVVGNFIYNAFVGIQSSGSAHRGNIVGNWVDTCSFYGIYLASGDDWNIQSNYVYNITTEGIYLTGADDCLVEGNYLHTCGSNAIQIDSDSAGCKIGRNFFNTITLAPVRDDSTTTIYGLSKPFQFTEAIVGTISTTSPTGVDVDANTEQALAWGQIPDEVTQVMRIKIWAVATDAPIGAGGQMHLEITFNAGASNAAYNTANKSWNLANFDSEEADYIANDIVHWSIIDSDVGTELLNLAAGDSFEIFAIHEAGADPDGATDARFRVVEIEYV